MSGPFRTACQPTPKAKPFPWAALCFGALMVAVPTAIVVLVWQAEAHGRRRNAANEAAHEAADLAARTHCEERGGWVAFDDRGHWECWPPGSHR